jgi:hypothetical protein
MNIILIIMIVLWATLSLNLLAGIAPKMSNSSWVDKMMVGLLITAGAPFMFINQSLETIIAVFLPGGMEDDDDDERIG